MAAVQVDRRMPDFAGDVRRAVKELAVEDQPATDAGADRDPDHVRRAFRGALPPFADGGAVGVIVERRGKIQPLADAVAQGEVAPAEVGGNDDETLVAIQWTGGSDADANEVAPVGARLRDGVENDAFDQADDSVRDTFRAQL